MGVKLADGDSVCEVGTLTCAPFDFFLIFDIKMVQVKSGLFGHLSLFQERGASAIYASVSLSTRTEADCTVPISLSKFPAHLHGCVFMLTVTTCISSCCGRLM